MFKIYYNFDISEISYIKVGGKVKLYIVTDEINIIRKILKINRNIKYIGNTSNIFFSFSYSDTIYIKYINNRFKIDNKVMVGSSLSIPFLIRKLLENNIGGFEKMIGIPASVGGALINNASSYFHSISDYLIEIIGMDINGKINKILKDEIQFNYHNSSLRNRDFLIICAFLKIQNFNKLICLENIDKVNKMRKKTQPHNKMTLGSIFVKDDRVIVPKILEELGVKGKKRNKTIISYIHSNFFEVEKDENFENITSLIEETNQLLYNKLGYYIDLEIERLKR